MQPNEIRTILHFRSGGWEIQKHYYGIFMDYRITRAPEEPLKEDELLDLYEVISSAISYKHDQ